MHVLLIEGLRTTTLSGECQARRPRLLGLLSCMHSAATHGFGAPTTKGTSLWTHTWLKAKQQLYP